MTEFDAILADIRTNPADDFPRLALADWLMEQDDLASRSRGEFIHARCRAAALAPRDPERGILQRQAEGLREEHEIEWLGGLADHLETWDFERGMIVASLSHRAFLRGAFARLIACPGWKWVIGLRGTALSGRDLAALFRRSHLESITSLDLRDCALSSAGLHTGLRALGASRHLSQLVSLDLGYARLGDRGFRAVFESRQLPALRTLLVDNDDIGPEGIVTLAASANLPRLESLDLSRNPIETRGVITLARSSHHAGLRELRLCTCGIHDRGGIALATSQVLVNLTLLDLRDNPFGEATRDELRDRFGARVILG